MDSQSERDSLLEQALDRQIDRDAFTPELIVLLEMALQVRMALAEVLPPPHELLPGRSAFLAAAIRHQPHQAT